MRDAMEQRWRNHKLGRNLLHVHPILLRSQGARYRQDSLSIPWTLPAFRVILRFDRILRPPRYARFRSFHRGKLVDFYIHHSLLACVRLKLFSRINFEAADSP